MVSPQPIKIIKYTDSHLLKKKKQIQPGEMINIFLLGGGGFQPTDILETNIFR